MELPKASLSDALLAQKIPGGRTVGSNAFHLIKVNWTAPTFEEDRCVRAFVRLRRRARNNSNVRVTCLRTRKLSLFPWDQRLESPNWIHQTRRSRLCFPKGEIRP